MWCVLNPIFCLLLCNGLPFHESEFGISTKGNSRLLRKDFCKPAMELHFPTHVTRSSAPHLSSVCLHHPDSVLLLGYWQAIAVFGRSPTMQTPALD